MSDEIKLKMSIAKKGKTFSDEHKRNLSLAHKGKIPSNIEQFRQYRKGRPLTKEHKAKIGLAHKGKKMSDEAKLKISIAGKGRAPWNKGMKGLFSGSDNPNWQPDRSKIKKYKKRLGSLYTQWRKDCHKRDNYSCRLKSEECSGQLEVHHIERWGEHKHLRYEVNNGITLCHFHHPRKKKDEESMKSLFKSLVN